ncbi:N-acetyltransferase [Sporosarcina sp. BI001-red]|uniref:GNAT family N-acetyltransferase n=1 Tax=Sporosarcina sp. BI001-red TaxID=2282866 RepID=UPI000E27B08F|nr:GNAT family protein [Sporosarcina sp. BI001-red]REB05504.1 N-acetyltransferase [Sporosarcina sp. BI001-red]
MVYGATEAPQLDEGKKEVLMTDITKPIEEITIRNAQPEDAESIVKFYNVVGGETDYLSFGGDEYPQSADAVAASIKNMEEEKGNCMLLLMEGERIVGMGTIDSSTKRRFLHVGTLGIVIRQSHAGKGLGLLLMNALINWSKDNGQTEKIMLVTRADNEVAIGLYEKLGFKQEGVFHQDSFDGERYYDSLSMALFL